eukprot:gene26472-biopygen16586
MSNEPRDIRAWWQAGVERVWVAKPPNLLNPNPPPPADPSNRTKGNNT